MEEITEYTQNGDCRFLACIPSRWKNQPWLVRVGGARPPPFGLLPSRTKLQCTLLLRGQIHFLYFHSTLYVLCGRNRRRYYRWVYIYVNIPLADTRKSPPPPGPGGNCVWRPVWASGSGEYPVGVGETPLPPHGQLREGEGKVQTAENTKQTLLLHCWI